MKKLFTISAIVLLASCSSVSHRSPSSIILDEAELSSVKKELSELLRDDKEAMFSNKEKIEKIIAQVKFESQAEVLKDAFDRGMYRPKVLSLMLGVTKENDLKLLKKYEDAFYGLPDERMEKALKVILSERLIDKYKDSYFKAIVRGEYNRADASYDIVSKVKLLGEEEENIQYLASDIAGNDYFKFNPDLEEEFFKIIPKIQNPYQLIYLTRMVDNEYKDISSKFLLNNYKYIDYKDIKDFYLQYIRVVASHKQKPSGEVLNLLSKFNTQEMYFLSSRFSEFFLQSFSLVRATDDANKVLYKFEDFNQTLKYVLKELKRKGVNLNNTHVLSDYLADVAKYGERVDKNMLELILSADNEYHRGLIRSIIEKHKPSTSAAKLTNKELKKYKSLLPLVTNRDELEIVKLGFSGTLDLENLLSEEGVDIAREISIRKKAKKLGIDLDKNFINFDPSVDIYAALLEIEKTTERLNTKRRKELFNNILLFRETAWTQEESVKYGSFIRLVSFLPDRVLDSEVLIDIKYIDEVLLPNIKLIEDKLGRENAFSILMMKPTKKTFESIISTLSDPNLEQKDIDRILKAAKYSFSQMSYESNLDVSMFDEIPDVVRHHLDSYRDRKLISKDVYEYLHSRTYFMYSELIDYSGDHRTANYIYLFNEIEKLSDLKREALDELVKSGESISVAVVKVAEMRDGVAEVFKNLPQHIDRLDQKVKKGDFWFIDYLQDIRREFEKENTVGMSIDDFSMILEAVERKRAKMDKPAVIAKKRKFSLKGCKDLIAGWFRK